MQPSTRLASNDRFAIPDLPFLVAVLAGRSCPTADIRLLPGGARSTSCKPPDITNPMSQSLSYFIPPGVSKP